MTTKNLTLVLGDQLFQNHPAFSLDTDFVMVESGFLTSKLRYHKFKLAYIMTTMREYWDYLETQKKTVHYTELDQKTDFEEVIGGLINTKGYTELLICEIADKYFATYISEICDRLKIKLTILPSPMFLTPKAVFGDFVESKKGKRLLMNDFYTQQRKRLQILVDDDDKPIGGKWSFDEDNRKKLPKTVEIPKRQIQFLSKHYQEIKELINQYFLNNPGQIPDHSWLPVNFDQSNQYLEDFVANFLTQFGDYEDALTSRSDLVFHSCLSALLNNGLLTPQQVLDKVLGQTDIPINSLEGFVRQIIGWREWVKGLYDNVYKDDFRNMNFFEANNDLPDYFYHQTQPNNFGSNINPPLDLVLDKVNRLAYCHHIERLMVLANWMLLSEYNPAQCYDWFVEMFIDSSEWVMVANVMGMGLYADGGIFATKPYVAGGNYLKKMSDYPSGKCEDDWEKLWTDKFWYFVLKHEKVFLSNPRMNMLIKARKNKTA
jgi:deoxyribodipyrimidine photolyase-related protein